MNDGTASISRNRKVRFRSPLHRALRWFRFEVMYWWHLTHGEYLLGPYDVATWGVLPRKIQEVPLIIQHPPQPIAPELVEAFQTIPKKPPTPRMAALAYLKSILYENPCLRVRLEEVIAIIEEDGELIERLSAMPDRNVFALDVGAMRPDEETKAFISRVHDHTAHDRAESAKKAKDTTDYYAAHKSCPKCRRESDIHHVSFGWSYNPPGVTKEDHKVRCRHCGWSGIIDDLKPPVIPPWQATPEALAVLPANVADFIRAKLAAETAIREFIKVHFP